MIDHLRTNDALCHWRQTWWGASNNSTFDLRSFRNSPCVLYWKDKVKWVCNDMRDSKLHNFLNFWVNYWSIVFIAVTTSFALRGWFVALERVEIRNVEIKSVSVVQTEHRLISSPTGDRQEPYNYTLEEHTPNTLTTRQMLSSVRVVIFWWQIMLTGYIVFLNNQKFQGQNPIKIN